MSTKFSMNAGAFQTEEDAQIEGSPARIGCITVGTAIVAGDILDKILQGALVTSLLSSIDCSRHVGRLHGGRCDTNTTESLLRFCSILLQID